MQCAEIDLFNDNNDEALSQFLDNYETINYSDLLSANDDLELTQALDSVENSIQHNSQADVTFALTQESLFGDLDKVFEEIFHEQ